MLKLWRNRIASTTAKGPGTMLKVASLGFGGAGLVLASSSNTNNTKRLLNTSAAAAAAAGGGGESIPGKLLTLYQYQVCPFCNKAQTGLEYFGVPHKRVEVHPLSKKEMKFSEYRMVPFLVIENEKGEKTQVNGSDDIVDFAEATKTKPSNNPNSEDIKKWRDWVNNRLIKLLPPNIYRTPSEALQAFDYIANSSNFSYFERLSAKYSGAVVMYFIAKNALKKYNIVDPRKELAECMELWSLEGLANGKDFHGGTSPDKADLAVYGVIRAIEGNYATWTDMTKNVGPKFWTWYNKMKTVIPPAKLL
jgi:microsomal prostaglandin-E synthase 2